jgi:hypothetical protein
VKVPAVPIAAAFGGGIAIGLWAPVATNPTSPLALTFWVFSRFRFCRRWDRADILSAPGIQRISCR